MTTNKTIGDIRQVLTAKKVDWVNNIKLPDNTPLPNYATGTDLSKVPLAKNVERIDITQSLQTETSNPFLRLQRVNSGFLKALPTTESRITALPAPPANPAPPSGSPGDAMVDWRNRWGWNWLTRIKDQDPCYSCWIFSAVGVVEAMARIEHGCWSLRSEGDVMDGLGVTCGQSGGPSTAFDWMKANGVADPGCRAYETANMPVPPTVDRNGRTVRLDNYVSLNNIADQKAWLNQVGPISASFTCYYDWKAFGYTHQTGVYTCSPETGVDGGHSIVIVGYDDSRQAWLIRNSWGDSWGMAGAPGYIWMGYGEADIDSFTKYGVLTSAVNPDPWTKRANHNGNIVESGDGTLHRNFEVWAVAPGNAIRHYWRDGNTLNWAVAETQANDCSMIPTVTATTYNRNFEMIYPTTGGRLHHIYFDQVSGHWNDGPVFGPNNVNGVVGFIQSDFGAPGNLEVVAALSDNTLVHWWRNEANQAWAQSAVFGSGVAFGSATLIQRLDRGLDYVCVNTDGTMQRYCRQVSTGAWVAEEKFGANVHSAPVMIRSEFGATDEATSGNYELCVAVNGQIQHWWSGVNNNPHWSQSATFGANVKDVLGLIEGSFGFDLEVIALLHDGSIQHFWRSNQWYAGPVFGTSPVPTLVHNVLHDVVNEIKQVVRI
ncbi:MAG: C1 family peptidase [Ginsengibacter sp.]